MEKRFVKVCHHPNQSFAGMVCSLLEENEFHPLKLEYSSHISLAGGRQGYFIELPVEEAALARKMLEENDLGKFVVPDETA